MVIIATFFMGYHCFRCKNAVEISPNQKVGRRDSCEKCGSDLHCCYNCHFYEAKAYNECREPSADRVVDKERSNYCDFFQMADSTTGAVKGDKATDNKKRLDDLFK